MKKAWWLVPCLAMALSAADVSGKWTGTIQVEDSNTVVRAEFEQKGSVVTGRIGRQGEQEPSTISNGKVDGNKVTFEVTSPESAGAFKFDLTVAGDRMDGEMKGAMDTGPISGTVQLKRQP